MRYDNDIKILHHSLFEGKRITKKESNVKVGLINVPCGGFGDIVNCKTFSDYLKSWYSNINVKNINLKKEFNHYIILSAPTRFVRDWIVSRYADKILDIIKIFKTTKKVNRYDN